METISIDKGLKAFEIGDNRSNPKLSNVFSDYEPTVKVNVKPDSAGNVKEIEKDYHLHSNAKFKEASEGKDYFHLFTPKSSSTFKIDSGTEDPFSFLLTDGKHIKLKERPLAPYYRYNVAGKSYFDLSMRKMDEEISNDPDIQRKQALEEFRNAFMQVYQN